MRETKEPSQSKNPGLVIAAPALLTISPGKKPLTTGTITGIVLNTITHDVGVATNTILVPGTSGYVVTPLPSFKKLSITSVPKHVKGTGALPVCVTTIVIGFPLGNVERAGRFMDVVAGSCTDTTSPISALVMLYTPL